jgi:hypothetical protein
MDQQSLLIIMAVFTGVAAVALLIQAGFLFGIYKASRAMQDTVARLTPRVETLIDSSRQTLDESRRRISEISERATEILDTTKLQLVRVDELLSDASVRTRRQLEHAEMLIDDAMDRAHQTVNLLHTGVMWPLREINGVMAGVKAAVQFLIRGMRPNPERFTVDEEMFI